MRFFVFAVLWLTVAGAGTDARRRAGDSKSKTGRYSMRYCDYCELPFGRVKLLSEDGTFLSGIGLSGAPEEGEYVKELPVFRDTKRWLEIYFSGRDPGFLPDLAPEGTPFRQAVWRLLLDIPYGSVVSYKTLALEVAAASGRERMSARAVGGAVGRNPIPIIIPCHRVVGVDGSLVGYSGGLEIKRLLLGLEGFDKCALTLDKAVKKAEKGALNFRRFSEGQKQ